MRVIVSKISKVGSLCYEADIDDYKDYYEHLECDCFDVVMVKWHGHDISIYVDDEGMLKEGNLGRMVEGYHAPLFGNMVICGGVDEEGETLPLPSEIGLHHIDELISLPMYKIKD